MEPIRLPNICYVINVVEKLQQQIDQNIRHFCIYPFIRKIDRFTNDEKYDNEFCRTLSDFCGSQYTLAYIDSLIVVEYIYNSLSVHFAKDVKEHPEYILEYFINTLTQSSTSVYNKNEKVMGFTWSSSKNSRLMENIIANSYVDFESILRTENIKKYDIFTLYKITRKCYALQGRYQFCRYYDQPDYRERLLTYQVAPEILESYVSRTKITKGNIYDPVLYRGIIEGTE